MRDEPKNTQKPEMDRLLSRQVAQSESENAFNQILEIDGKNMPCLGVLLMYFKTRKVAYKCTVRGVAKN